MIGCNPDETQTVAEFKNLVFSDEFDTDNKINADIWTFDIGTGSNGWGNNEEQFYTNRIENVSVQNGILIIKALKEDYNGSGYTSSKILTKGLKEQAYGRFEARIQLPTGQGMWPAFWLLGANCGDGTANTEVWPTCGEIDIMEHWITPSQPSGYVQSALHTPSSSGATINHGGTIANNLGNSFHLYSMNWSPLQITFLLDGVQFYFYNQFRIYIFF